MPVKYSHMGRGNGYPIPIELYCRHKNLQASIRTLFNELQLVEAAIVEAAIVEADRAHEAERAALRPTALAIAEANAAGTLRIRRKPTRAEVDASRAANKAAQRKDTVFAGESE